MIHVWIVDDDEDDRDLLTLAIHEADPTIKCAMARDGKEALDGLRLTHSRKPHLIFLDLNMPRVDGVKFIKELKKDRTLQDIPIVVYTTSKLEKDREEMMALGATHFLTKPNSLSSLCRAVEGIFVKEMMGSRMG
jgi:CheY-like chemotaxis protein